jgi:glutamate-1-semialdehyde 2,1-aminomutase
MAVCTDNSQRFFEEARNCIPGGVNSPVRAFKSVGGTPRFIERGNGAMLTDVDGNEFVDFVLSWGPLVLGHAHPAVVEALAAAAVKGTSFGAPTTIETELARLVIDTVQSVEMVRFVNSGTEATMSALRLARAHTGRSKIIKFNGCYHGHADLLLVQAGSGVATLGLPDSPGVPAGTVSDTISLPFNDLAAVEQAFAAHRGEIAGVIAEPIGSNMGFVMPADGFLPGLQELCRQNGAVFILDEVMTGFRVAPGGAQERFELDPDLTCLGKVIGGGLPVGAYAGKRRIMETVAPAGPMYQAGTLSGNPLAMTAGLITIRTLLEGDNFDVIAKRTAALADGVKSVASEFGRSVQVAHAGSMFGWYFLNESGAGVAAAHAGGLPVIRDFESAKQYADTETYARFFHFMLDAGFYFAPSQYEAGFMSLAHSDNIVERTLEAVRKCFGALSS